MTSGIEFKVTEGVVARILGLALHEQWLRLREGTVGVH
jgi:hypothetical protein